MDLLGTRQAFADVLEKSLRHYRVRAATDSQSRNPEEAVLRAPVGHQLTYQGVLAVVSHRSAHALTAV
jgi:hypothetical protein